MIDKSFPSVSFEFFPPNNKEMELILWKTVKRLATLKPKFVSITYGADGSTQDRTFSLVSKIIRAYQMKSADDQD